MLAPICPSVPSPPRVSLKLSSTEFSPPLCLLYSSFLLLPLPPVLLLLDAPYSSSLSLAEPASTTMIALISLYGELHYLLLFILLLVLYLLLRPLAMLTNSSHLPFYSAEHSVLELLWTLLPSFLLLAISIPSFSLLYSLDSCLLPSLSAKVIASQWY